MPIYEFKCLKCGTLIAEIRQMGDYTRPRCQCGSHTEMIISVPRVNVWNPDWKFPNLSTDGEGYASFKTEKEYRDHLKSIKADEVSLGIREV